MCWLLLLLIPLVAGCGDGSGSGRVGSRPDVVLAVIDTLRADHLPLYGYERGATPCLDAWAQRGVVFANAWSASSWTGPATASIFTSVYPLQHGVTRNLMAVRRRRGESGGALEVNRIPDGLETLPEALKRAGYGTYGISANPCVGIELGFERGFDRFESRSADAADVNATLAAWRDEILAQEAYFVYLHYLDPHGEYEQREPWYARFSRDAGDDDPARKLAAYDSEIAYVDRHLSEALELLGVDESTLVILTSDHGEEFGDHGGRGHGFTLYSELTRALLVVHQPGVEPRVKRVAHNVSTLDVLPTIRGVLGLPASPQDEGVSLAGYYLGAPPAERYLHAMRTDGWGPDVRIKRSVVYGRQKVIVTEPGGAVELYDLAADPGEREDLAASDRERAEGLLRRVTELVESAPRWSGGEVDVLLSPEQSEALRQLGYVEGPEDS